MLPVDAQAVGDTTWVSNLPSTFLTERCGRAIIVGLVKRGERTGGEGHGHWAPHLNVE
jgi:hypothetical protein